MSSAFTEEETVKLSLLIILFIFDILAWSMEEGRACMFFTQNFTVVTEQ